MSYQHRIPIHLEQEDKFLLTLTGRQTLVIGLGLTFGYMIGSDFPLLPGAVLFVCCVTLAVVVAFVRYHHRHLEQWAIIALMYSTSPAVYIRGRLMEENREEARKVLEVEEKESEEW
jgi:hypothetical protein